MALTLLSVGLVAACGRSGMVMHPTATSSGRAADIRAIRRAGARTAAQSGYIDCGIGALAEWKCGAVHSSLILPRERERIVADARTHGATPRAWSPCAVAGVA